MSVRRRRVRSGCVRVAVILLLGAVVNVAVAWGCSAQTFDGLRISKRTADRADIPPFIDLEWGKSSRVNGSSEETIDIYAETGIGAHREYWMIGDDSNTSSFYIRRINVYWTGLPSDALRCQLYMSISGDMELREGYWITLEGHDRLMPFQPVWPGFAINTVFYAAILWLLFAAPFTLRRWRRVRRGLCVKCAYPVGTSDVCTECGEAISRPSGAMGCSHG